MIILHKTYETVILFNGCISKRTHIMKNTYHSKEEAISLYNRKNICIQNSTNKNKFVGVKCMMGKTIDPIL